MKSLFRIYRRYIFSALWIAAAVICVNLAVLLAVQLLIRSQSEGEDSGSSARRSELARIADGLEREAGGRISLNADGEAALKEAEAQFAFLLSGDGVRLWGWNLPEGVKERYSVGEVASFSRWYLLDYPVKVWNCGEGLLVVANSPDSIAKYPVELSMDSVRNVPLFLLAVLGANFLLILVLAVLSGYRLYEGLRPIASGLDRLVDGRRVAVPENGIAGDLARRLNQVSRILETQREDLNRRDTARTEWISGVSHDIRTPLSMVMGYADSLENDPSLPQEKRREAAIIREQSLKIKTLIEDLNLTSKLEYHMQPLRVRDFMPAALLRQAVVSVLNGTGQGDCELETDIDEALEPVVMRGDADLLSRALQNLIGNSIRHNPGCRIWVSGSLETGEEGRLCRLSVRDDGSGIPERVCRILTGEERERADAPDAPHIMGLRIVSQIAAAHGGFLSFSEDGREAVLHLPVSRMLEERERRKKKWWEILWYGEGRTPAVQQLRKS